MRKLSLFFLCILIGACAAESSAPAPKARTQAATTPDYPAAAYAQALAYGKGRQANVVPSFVVVHVAQGYYKGTISWFQDKRSGVSSHYVVSKDGDVTQMVKEVDTAYHVGHSISITAVGIEHEGFVAEPTKWFTDAMYGGSAKLIKDIAERWGFPLDRCHILGHNEVPDPKNACVTGGSEHHTDPGKDWDWNKLMTKIGGSTAPCAWDCKKTTGSLVGYVRKGGIASTNPAVAGAKVVIGTGGSSTTTDAKGFFRFDKLALTYLYKVTVSAPGLKPQTRQQAVLVPVDQYLNFAMQPGPPVLDAAVKPLDAGVAPKTDLAQGKSDGASLSADASPGSSDAASSADAGVQADPGGGCSLAAPLTQSPAVLLALLLFALISRNFY